MKFIISLLIILSFISISLCQTSTSGSSCSSTSSSSEECPTGYSGINCSQFTHYVDSYRPASHGGSYISFYGNFGNTHEGLTITVGNISCRINWVSDTSIDCTTYDWLVNEFYDVNITQNGVSWFKPSYYRYQTNCVKGQSFNGYCQCSFGYIGELCDTQSPPFIETITSCSNDGGNIHVEGWFGYDPQLSPISMFIGNKQVRISKVSPMDLYGVAPQGNGTQDITFYDLNNTLTTTVQNGFQYDSSLCYNDCFNNGVCNNGLCECFYPYIGTFCSHTF